MINVLYSAKTGWEIYAPALRAAFAKTGLTCDLRQDFAPETVDYIVFAPNGSVRDLRPYTRTKAVLGLWAGVEEIVKNETLTQPLCRMVDHGLTEGMVEWVTGHVLRHHLGMDAHIHGQDGIWRDVAPPLARERKVCVLGLGALGKACAEQLASLNFEVHGWARSQKSVAGVTCHAGEQGLSAALKGADIVVLLLPQTPETTDILNAETFALVAPGAVVINPGRGPLIDDQALLDALESGLLSHATLDVFRVEPLPVEHPFWDHPKVTVTPHIASETRAVTAAEVIAENIRRGEAGAPFAHRVDRTLGY
ncbi:MAG: glyoxylate/hydroxypyruvate reductase A [Pseudomonadota bacterium]